MLEKLATVALIALMIVSLIIMPVYTFGYAASHTTNVAKSCNDCVMERALLGFVSAATWPLYWSWELQR